MSEESSGLEELRTRVLQTRLVFIIGYLALAEDRKGNLTSFNPCKEKKRK